jgi:hypothetical protein
MNTTENLPGFEQLVKPFKFSSQPYEYKVVPLRECPTPETLQFCDTPDKAADYWRLHVPKNPYFNPECECFTVLLLNTRRRVKAHQIVSFGTHDTILVHPISVFRLAVITCAAAVVLMHNHPSEEPTPSEADFLFGLAGFSFPCAVDRQRESGTGRALGRVKNLGIAGEIATQNDALEIQGAARLCMSPPEPRI